VIIHSSWFVFSRKWRVWLCWSSSTKKDETAFICAIFLLVNLLIKQILILILTIAIQLIDVNFYILLFTRYALSLGSYRKTYLKFS